MSHFSASYSKGNQLPLNSILYMWVKYIKCNMWNVWKWYILLEQTQYIGLREIKGPGWWKYAGKWIGQGGSPFGNTLALEIPQEPKFDSWNSQKKSRHVGITLLKKIVIQYILIMFSPSQPLPDPPTSIPTQLLFSFSFKKRKKENQKQKMHFW